MHFVSIDLLIWPFTPGSTALTRGTSLGLNELSEVSGTLLQDLAVGL